MSDVSKLASLPCRCTLLSLFCSIVGSFFPVPIVAEIIMVYVSELLLSVYGNEEMAFNVTFRIFVGILLLFVALSFKSKTNKSYVILSLCTFAFMHVVFLMRTLGVDLYFHGDGQTILGYVVSIPKVILLMGVLGVVKDLYNAVVKKTNSPC